MNHDDAVHAFENCFGCRPVHAFRAPGRINLIGEHTDYNGGLVLPLAINRELLVLGCGSEDGHITVHSQHFQATIRLDLDNLATDPQHRWSAYLVGVMELLGQLKIPVGGARIWIGGDLAPGAGLASSAALEAGVALALLAMADRKLSPMCLATLCRRAEQDYAGSPCGIMDQICCVSAKAGHALLIDCHKMTSENIAMNLGGARLVVIDSGVRHSTAGKGYATRRRECAATATTINQAIPSIRLLRDVTPEQIPFCAEHLDDTLVRRLRHVVTENGRVEAAVEALRIGDSATLGRLMSDSHTSLRDDFQVSCTEVDSIVAIAESTEGVYGARMTGGGFGGCVIALASDAAVARLPVALRAEYDGRYESNAATFTCDAVDGASALATQPV